MFAPPREASLRARALADDLLQVAERDGAAALAARLQDAVARLPSDCMELARAPRAARLRVWRRRCSDA